MRRASVTKEPAGLDRTSLGVVVQSKSLYEASQPPSMLIN